MDAAQIRELARVVIAAGGALSIYCGYKLFCEIPFGKNRAYSAVNGVAGAILALFGMALLMGDVRSVSQASSATHSLHQTRPTEDGSFTAPHSGLHQTADDWAI